MTIAGVILLIAGLAGAGLMFTGNTPAFLATLPAPFNGIVPWIVMAAVGAVLVYFNRRPGD